MDSKSKSNYENLGDIIKKKVKTENKGEGVISDKKQLISDGSLSSDEDV